MGKKITTSKLLELKKAKQKITALTAYDYPTAKLLDNAGIDLVLVGDSLGNVILGYQNTLPVTMDEMLICTKAVRRGVENALLVVDMPLSSFQHGEKKAINNAARLINEGGAEAVKIEGLKYLKVIKQLLKADIPVMGHLGFTPQSVNEIGGYKYQGKTKVKAKKIYNAAKQLEEIGVFAIVLEMIPDKLAKKISKTLKIPTIGIGAGKDCDGQILVLHDMLGLTQGKIPKFANKYADLNKIISKAVRKYISVTKSS